MIFLMKKYHFIIYNKMIEYISNKIFNSLVMSIEKEFDIRLQHSRNYFVLYLINKEIYFEMGYSSIEERKNIYKFVGNCVFLEKMLKSEKIIFICKNYYGNNNTLLNRQNFFHNDRNNNTLFNEQNFYEKLEKII